MARGPFSESGKWTNPHGVPPSVELLTSMRTGWEGNNSRRSAFEEIPTEATETAARHRVELAEVFVDDWLVIPAGNAVVRSADIEPHFRPNSSYIWLTGLAGEDQIGLVFEPGSAGRAVSIYGHDAPTRSSSRFFADHRHGEFWVEPRRNLSELQWRRRPSRLRARTPAFFTGRETTGR